VSYSARRIEELSHMPIPENSHPALTVIYVTYASSGGGEISAAPTTTRLYIATTVYFSGAFSIAADTATSKVGEFFGNSRRYGYLPSIPGQNAISRSEWT
jgi:hypothetical protein